jgi:hypothetical protein
VSVTNVIKIVHHVYRLLFAFPATLDTFMIPLLQPINVAVVNHLIIAILAISLLALPVSKVIIRMQHNVQFAAMLFPNV